MITTMMQLNGARRIFNLLFKKTTILILLLPCYVYGENIKPFTTDGCSSFPDGTLKQQSLWAGCCIRHDLAYWQGGTFDDRLSADQALEQCVAEVGEPEIAKLMLAGVRVGGTPYLPTSFRWGYGWPWPRGYKYLNNNEQQQIKVALDKLRLILDSLDQNINRE